MRITEKDLTLAITRLNAMTEGGKRRYEWEASYGGYRAVSSQADGTHRGSVDLSPRGTKREVYEWLHAFIKGIDVGMDAVHEEQFQAERLEG